MTTIKDLVFAIDETQKKYPENTFASVYGLIIGKVPNAYRHLTSTNGARERIVNVPVNELVEIIASELVRIYNYTEIVKQTDPEITNERNLARRYDLLKAKCPYYAEVRDFIHDMNNPNVNSILYFLNNCANLADALLIIEKYQYGYDHKYREILDHYGAGTKLPNYCETELINKISSDSVKVSGVRNVQVNQNAINRCYQDILSGAQIRNKNNLYNVGETLYAAQHVGKKRANQEDSVLIMEHPSNPDFKILVVSDGMGGGVAGEEVSNYTVRTVADWFKSLTPEMYNQPEALQQLFNHLIGSISQKMFEKYNDEEHTRAGATFTGAIVTRDKTIISQVGDSRAYIIKNGGVFKKGKASLITADESIVWPYDKDYSPSDPTKLSKDEIDDIRFTRGGNHITRCIGEAQLDASRQSFLLPNSAYDKLLLMSDGASDLLSVEGIEIICRSTPWDRIAKTLVEAAISKKSVRGFEWNSFYEKLCNGTLTPEELQKYNNFAQGHDDERHMGEISAGKDNTTVAGFYRR